MTPRILVAAEDAPLRASLARWLMAAGYGVELAESPKRVREVLANETIALAILAPDRMGGLELAREIIREVDRLILVTDRDEAGTTVQGVAACLTVPLSEPEVVACAKAAM